MLDYAMRWIQAKRSIRPLREVDKLDIQNIQKFLDLVPAELISQRALSCNEYARALFHLEHYCQRVEQEKKQPGERANLLKQLQDIYANIDEPDGLEGMSTQLHALDLNQQVLSHKKAGRWAAAQTWYETKLAETPDDSDIQVELLNCLKQGGYHGE